MRSGNPLNNAGKLVVQTLGLSFVFHAQAEHNPDTPMFQDGGYCVLQAQSNRKTII